MRDPYKFLNLPYDVTEQALNSRYRDLAIKLHGDHGGSDEMMKLINEARDQIRDYIRNGIKFSPGAPEEKPPPDDTDDEPDPEPERKRSSSDERTKEKYQWRTDEEPPKWGPGAQTWEMGGGTYSPPKPPVPRIVVAFVALIGVAVLLSLLGSLNTSKQIATYSPAPPPAPTWTPPRTPSAPPSPPSWSQPTTPPPRPALTGYLHEGDLFGGHTIGPTETFGIDIPIQGVTMLVLAGEITLTAPNGAVLLPCSTQPFSLAWNNGHRPTTPMIVSSCNGQWSLIKALQPDVPAAPLPQPAYQPSPQPVARSGFNWRSGPPSAVSIPMR